MTEVEKDMQSLRAEVKRLRDGNEFLSRELGRVQADADHHQQIVASWERGHDYWFALARAAEEKLAKAGALLERNLSITTVEDAEDWLHDLHVYLDNEPPTLECSFCDVNHTLADECSYTPSTTVRRWAFDAGRGEMFEIAKGAFVLHGDYEQLETRTNADQGVLNACAAMYLSDDDPDSDPIEPQEVGEDCYIYTDDQLAVVRAELVRRSLK